MLLLAGRRAGGAGGMCSVGADWVGRLLCWPSLVDGWSGLDGWWAGVGEDCAQF